MTENNEIDDYIPVDCVLCDNSSETPEEHERHMKEVHGLWVE